MAINEEKRKAYDDKNGINAYHHRYTKAGQAQSKAYDAHNFPGDKKSPAHAKKKELAKKIKVEDRSRAHIQSTRELNPGKKKVISFREHYAGEDKHGNMRD